MRCIVGRMSIEVAWLVAGVSRKKHARFLAGQAAAREAELDAPLTVCLFCRKTLTRRMLRDGLVVQLGPGSLCRPCYDSADVV